MIEARLLFIYTEINIKSLTVFRVSRFQVVTSFPRDLAQNLGELLFLILEMLQQLFRRNPELMNELVKLGLLTFF
jgi:hypothetical protein